MILRVFARVHGRLRRRFFRLNRATRYGLAVLGVIVLIGLAQFGLAWHYAHVMPWYDSQATVYAAWQRDDRFFQHDTVVAQALTQATGQTTDELVLVLDALKATQAAQYRFVAKQGGAVFYALGAQASAGVLPDGWQAELIDTQRGVLAIHTQSAISALPSNLQWHWFTPMRLRALQVRFPVVLTVHQEPWPLFYGALDIKDEGWNVFLSPASGPIRHAVLTEQPFIGALAFVHTSQALPSAVRDLPFMRQISSPVWTALFSTPVRITLLNGKLADLLDPFSSEPIWQLAMPATSEQANGWLQTVLQTLMMRFPLAEQRILPDKSIVFELKRKADFFLPPGMTIDVNEHATGTLTFPHDQITYHFENGQLIAGKGNVSDETQTLPMCQLPQAMMEAGLASQTLGISLWKTLYLGLDKDKLAICVRW